VLGGIFVVLQIAIPVILVLVMFHRRTAPAGPLRAAPPFAEMWMLASLAGYVLPFLLSFVLATIYSMLVDKHRPPVLAAGERSVRLASLWQRGLAKTIDAAIALGPLAAGAVLILLAFSEEKGAVDRGWAILGALACFFGFFWSIAFLLLVSLEEGKTGKSPGKTTMKIRVAGEDLEPCGFPRAIVRNLLLFIDGIFNFLVGLLLAALTRNRQRLGDIVAQTVVVSDLDADR
jgi:uncharacterized RDD family membrane protein YckC